MRISGGQLAGNERESASSGEVGSPGDRIRSATTADRDGLARLFRAAGLRYVPSWIERWMERGVVLVLDLTESLGGAACVELDCVDDDAVHARLQFIVIDPGLVGTGTEERLITALLAVCEASGCVDIGVGDPPQ